MFVKYRVTVAEYLTELNCWRWISSKENPTDLISESSNVDKIKNCILCWYRLSFLYQNIKFKSHSKLSVENTDLYVKDLWETMSSFVQKQNTLEIINNCSSFNKQQRLTASGLHFIKGIPNTEVLAFNQWKFFCCFDMFSKNSPINRLYSRIQFLNMNTVTLNSRHLLKLYPFIYPHIVIRMKRRLKFILHNVFTTYHTLHAVLKNPLISDFYVWKNAQLLFPSYILKNGLAFLILNFSSH